MDQQHQKTSLGVVVPTVRKTSVSQMVWQKACHKNSRWPFTPTKFLSDWFLREMGELWRAQSNNYESTINSWTQSFQSLRFNIPDIPTMINEKRRGHKILYDGQFLFFRSPWSFPMFFPQFISIPRPAKEKEREDAWGVQVRVPAKGQPNRIHEVGSVRCPGLHDGAYDQGKVWWGYRSVHPAASKKKVRSSPCQDARLGDWRTEEGWIQRGA